MLMDEVRSLPFPRPPLSPAPSDVALMQLVGVDFHDGGSTTVTRGDTLLARRGDKLHVTSGDNLPDTRGDLPPVTSGNKLPVTSGDMQPVIRGDMPSITLGENIRPPVPGLSSVLC